MKANFLTEMFPSIFVKGHAIVFVKLSNNFIEKHYYKITEDKRLLIYPETDERFEDNPTIKATSFVFDEKSKSLIFIWKKGETIVTPIFGNTGENLLQITSQQGFRLIDMGRRLERLNNPALKKDDPFQLIMLIVLLSLGSSIITLFFVYMISQEMGIQLIG